MRLFSKILPFIFVTTVLASCSKNDDPAPQPPTAPKITAFGVKASDTTIVLGAEIAFKPTVSAEGNIVYSWNVDNQEKSATLAYTFKPEKTGNYTVTYTVSNESGKDIRSLNVCVKLYKGGFFIVNEGWFGHEMGSVNHFDPEVQKLTPTVYKAANDPLELGNTTTFGTLWNGSYYFVSKQGRRLVKADQLSLADGGSLEDIGGDGRAFVGVSASQGVVTTSGGAYVVSLNPLKLGQKLENTDGAQCGGVYATSNHVFVVNSRKGIQVYSVTDNYKLVKEYGKGSVGFTLAKDGSLWAAAETKLLKINVKTLDMEEIALPDGVKINSSWGAWNKGPLVASKTENSIYFTKSGMWGGGNEVYRYKIGDISSLASIFAKGSDATDSFYGGGIEVDPETGDIIATYTHEGWSDSYKDNRLVVFDAVTGKEKLRFKYEGFWFPSHILFNN